MKNCLFLFISLVPIIFYGQSIEPLDKKNGSKIENTLSELDLIDTSNKPIIYKNPQRHRLELSTGASIPLNYIGYKFLTDFSLGLGYRFLHPLKKDNKRHYLFIGTNYRIGNNFKTELKKFSFLSFYEIGYYEPKATNTAGYPSFLFSLGILNYNFYTSNPIYYINSENEIDELYKLNSKYITFRFGVSFISWLIIYNPIGKYQKGALSMNLNFPIKFSKNEKK